MTPTRPGRGGVAGPIAAEAGPRAGRHTGAVTVLSSDGPARRGVVRLLNTAGGRVLCLAGDVDEATVDSHLRRYGREPARVDGIDAGSVTALSAAGVDLVLDHLDAAGWAGRPVTFARSAAVERELTDRGVLRGVPVRPS